MRINRLKAGLLASAVAATALFSTVTCIVPDIDRYLDNTVIIVDRPHHYDDDDDGGFFVDYWGYDCCW